VRVAQRPSQRAAVLQHEVQWSVVMNIYAQAAGGAYRRHMLQVGPTKWHNFLYALTLPNINRFSKFFHCQNQEKICTNTITKEPTTPQLCHYTTLCPTEAPRRGVLPSRQRPAF